MRLGKVILSFLTALAATGTAYADKPVSAPVDYRPVIGGVIRARWELLTDGDRAGDNRFALRNARVWIKGRVAAPLSYYLRADLCDMGKMKFLDGWMRFSFPKGFEVQVGQFRIPFGRDSFRGPGTYIFINRSFIGRDVANNRAVGVQGAYHAVDLAAPVNVWAGVFSNNSITDHSGWNDKMTVAAKASVSPGPFTLTAGMQTLSPDSVRINMANAALTFATAGLTVEAEYMYKHYAGDAFDNCHAYNLWVDYGIPLRKSFFDNLSFQGRYEGCGPHASGQCDECGRLTVQQPSRRRMTVGTTLAYVHKYLRCELKLNYEKYFYKSDYTPAPDRADKIAAELVVVF